MPRGGRRPGAGAPKGNFNHLTRGQSSLRMRLIYLALLAYPDKRALVLDLRRAGYVQHHHFDSPNRRPFIAFLHHYFFVDKEEAIALHSLKPTAPLIETPPPPTVQSNTTHPSESAAPQTPASPLQNEKVQIQSNTPSPDPTQKEPLS